MKKRGTVYKALTTISQFSINMLVPILACSAAGYYIDRALGTGWVAIALFFLGAAAGFRNVYILAIRIISDGPDAYSPYGRLKTGEGGPNARKDKDAEESGK